MTRKPRRHALSVPVRSGSEVGFPQSLGEVHDMLYDKSLERGSQLLHKYDEQAAHPESFQRISNLSGKLIQVKWQAYWYRNVL